MPDPGSSQAVFMAVFGALAIFVGSAGVIYWAIHNMGNGLRKDMNQMEERLRTGMSSGFNNLYDTLSRHQHRDDGVPTITLATGSVSRFNDTSHG